MKDRKWQDAVVDFSKAARLGPRDPQIQMMLGAALEQMVQVDPQAVQLEVGAYQKALEIDPKYLPALIALSDLFTKEASQDPAAYLYTNAIEYTRQAHRCESKRRKTSIVIRQTRDSGMVQRLEHRPETGERRRQGDESIMG